MSAGAAAPESVLALLEHAVAEAGDQTAAITPDGSLTYTELDRAANALAGALSAAGIRPRERVALWLPNGIDWLVAHWAAARNGNVVVPLGTRLPPRVVQRRLEQVGARALFATTGFANVDLGAALGHVLAGASPDLQLVVVRGGDALDARATEWERFADRSAEPPELIVDPDDIHLIQFTSGTTGESKGALLAHRGLAEAARAHAEAWSLAPGDAVFVPNPFSHVLGIVYGCLMPAAAGAASATQSVFEVEPALALLEKSRAVAVTGAPTHLQMLAEHPGLSRFDLSRLRLAMTGGAAIAPEWVREVTRELGLDAVLNGYGMSEAGSVAQTRTSDSPEVLAASIGHLMPWLESRVIDPETGLDVRPIPAGADRADGERGELWIRGDAVMRGYLDDEDATRLALTSDGWLRTGDLVRVDAEGRMFFAGRLSDMFTVGGFNVHPLAVERVLEEHPAVLEAAVVGVDDERLGSIPVAFVRGAPDRPVEPDEPDEPDECGGNGTTRALRADALAAFCRERLASYEVPRRFHAVDDLPRNPTGKLDRRQLASLATEHACSATYGEPDAGVPPNDVDTCEPEEPLFGNYFVAAYPPFSRWSEDAASDFERALDTLPSEPVPLGLYCHIPFCVERCSYCYYLSHSGRQLARVDEYVEALVAELSTYAARPAVAGRTLDFVYFGGGTPSLLSADRLRRMLGGLAEALPWTDVREVTFECAPRSVTLEKMRVLRDHGVTRLSVGVQQLDDDVLSRNGRVHRVADVEAAYAAVREVGFDVVNLDLIVGLVGETEATLENGLERVLALDPDCVTVYQLEIPYNTPLCAELREGALETPPASWPEKRARTQHVFARLADAGYVPISTYAAVRDPDRHAFVYQDELYRGADLLGIGVSSFAYVQGVHHQNLVALEDYLEALAGSRLPLGRAYALSPDERAVRELVLQLKLGRVDRGRFREKHGVDPLERFAEPLRRFEALGWLRVEDDAVELTHEGFPRADRMLPSFYQQQHRVTRYS